MMHMLPRRVGVELIHDPDTSKGGIIIPNEAKERADQGIIKYIGADCDEFNIGDYVLFSGYTGANVEIEDEGLFAIIHKDYIVAKIDNPNYQIPGLYFRDKKGWGDLEKEIESLLVAAEHYTFTSQLGSKLAGDIIELVSKYNPYFSANYETAIKLCADAYQNTDFHKNNKIGWKHGDKKEFRDI